MLMQEVQTFLVEDFEDFRRLWDVGVVASSITAVSRNEGSEGFPAFVGCLCVCVYI